MIRQIFNRTAGLLLMISRRTGRTYNEINIIAYYFLIPFSWCVLLDLILDFHYFKVLSAGICIGFYVACRDFRTFSDSLFEKSVGFLNWFNRWGSNYIATSVWICVVVPLLVYALLLSLVF